MTRPEFVDFVRATFNAMDMITPAEGATAVLKAFDELDAAAVPPGAADARTPLTRYELQGPGFLVAEGPAKEPTKFSGTKVYLAEDVEAIHAVAPAAPQATDG